MRQIRKVEQRRDDPLVDRAIKALSDEKAVRPSRLDLLQALRNLARPRAMLAIALDMAQGVILQETRNGEPETGTTLAATTAMTLALRGWIESGQTAKRVLRYRITPAGRAALRDLTAEAENRARALAEAPDPGRGDRSAKVDPWQAPERVSAMPHHESPIQGLARRKDREGKPFLTRPMIRAAERLREDYELAQIGTDRLLDWKKLLQQAEARLAGKDRDTAIGQVTFALSELGPGLAEVVLRCCCLLEGLEATEKDMGWAARSGKVVLRIALQRLVLHYEKFGALGPKIG